ncbi:hypothetical protein PR202_ga07240 [Eleusine coracana subsp. coracana]|uniref:Calcineurin B-like protein n=1 Tax=Eleusine coracana subsp. coracana TaxID=191504 RepID=A0AAV5BWY3_ELECO|nr:hypothetical protein PR202_ga07240 [Eleusine coracana subsp. coracana]
MGSADPPLGGSWSSAVARVPIASGVAVRIFDLFDPKRNGVIDFGEFVRSLNIFHPDTPEAEKITFAFKLMILEELAA